MRNTKKAAQEWQATHVAGAGWGYHEGVNFRRLSEDLPVAATSEYANPGHVIVYAEDGKRMHVTKQALRPVGAA